MMKIKVHTYLLFTSGDFFVTSYTYFFRVSLVGSHEDQLAAITSLCKQEMKLLLNAKKAVPRVCTKTITAHACAQLDNTWCFLFVLLC